MAAWFVVAAVIGLVAATDARAQGPARARSEAPARTGRGRVPAAAQPSPQSSPERRGDEIAARLVVEVGVVADDRPVRLFTTVDNRSGLPVTVVFEDFRTPGFVHSGGCWSGTDAGPSCPVGASTTNRPAVVAAHDSLTLWSEVTRDPSQAIDGANVLLTASLRWQNSGGTVGHLTMVSSPVALAATYAASAPRAVALREWIVALGIPAIGGIVAFWFYRYQQNRTERHVIWTEMMKKVTADAEKHLLPLSGTAERFTDAVAAWRLTRTPADAADTLFQLLMLNFRIQQMADTIGGFYFRLMSAEVLASASWHAYKKQQDAVLGTTDEIERVIATMTASTTGGAFAKRRLGSSADDQQFRADATAVETTLPDFVLQRDPDYEMRAVQVLFAVIDVEVNRAFSKWYDRKPQVDRRGLAQQRQALAGQQAAAAAANGTAELERMLTALDAYLLDTAPWWHRVGIRLKRGLGFE